MIANMAPDECKRLHLRLLPKWKLVKLGLDYMQEIDQHYDSAPSRLIRERIVVRLRAGR